MEKHLKYVLYEPGDKVDVASEGDIPPPRDLVEQMYCSEQIHIPPTFPYILRQYCKAAIRTQPYDLLKWSTAYFHAMAQGEVPPVKHRLEYPPTDVPSGLTPGYLRVILRQLKRKKVVPTELLIDKWGGLCLNHNALKVMLEIGEFTDDEVNLLKFVAIAAGHLTQSLKQTMIIICEILTEEPEGGSAMIPFSTFCDLYTLLAKKNCGPPSAHPDLEETVEEQEEEELGVGSEDKTDDKLDIQTSAELHAEDLISEIVENVVAISPGEEEKSPELSETAIIEEQESNSKERDEGHEDKTDPPEDTGELHEEGQLTETNGVTGKDDKYPNKQSSLKGVSRQDSPEGVSRQDSPEGVSRATSVKFKEPVDTDSMNAEKNVTLLPEDHSSPPISEENSSVTIAKETVKEVVHRAEVAAEANKAEITAAQFLIKLRSETIAKKVRVQQTPLKKKPKPLRIHHEVPGIGPPVPDKQIDNVITYLHYWSARQEGMIMPRNINHFLCPPLDPPPPPEFIEASHAKCICGIGNPMASECHCTTASDN